MIQITKEQAKFLREKFPGLQITKTCKTKSNCRRAKRYVEESPKVVRALDLFAKTEGVL